MTDTKKAKVDEEAETKELVEEIKKMNKQWYEKTWLLILSLILGSASFVGGFFVQFESIWQSAVQTVFFIATAGFFVIVLSFVFNKAWQYSLKKKSANEYMLSLLLQLASITALLVNLILITVRFTTNLILAEVKNAFWFIYQKSNYSSLMDPEGYPWSYLFSADKFYFQYKLGMAFSQTFIILVVVYAILIVILGITSFFTYKKLKVPFNLKNHILYLFHPVMVFYYGAIILYELILKVFTDKDVKIKQLKHYHKFKRAALYMLVPLLLAGLFFGLYAFTNYSMWFIYDLYWPLFF